MANQSSPHTPMRVVFCTCPSIYSDIVLQEVIRSPLLQVVGVVASTRIMRKTGWNLWDIVLLVRRTGVRYATYLWLATSLYTLFKYLWRNDPVGTYLENHQVPIMRCKDVNSADGIAFVQACNPDMMLSAHFNQLIKPHVLSLPPYGCLNIHPGFLPEYKGVDPVILALARRERQVGVTVHYQDPGFDTGSVIVAGSIPVHPEDSLLSLNCSLFRLGIHLLLDKLSTTGGFPPGTPQEDSESYDSWPNTTIVSTLRRSGRNLIHIVSFLARCRGN